ncbi:MAG: hypothetical protein ABIP89_02455 [Polyangiaceae bacterium]
MKFVSLPEPPQPKPTARQRLAWAGLRATATRLAIVQELTILDVGTDRRAIARGLVAKGFDRVTVWRTLSVLAKAGPAPRLSNERNRDALKDALRAAGLRPSASRLAILRAMMSVDGALCARTLFARVAQEGVAPSTIWRNFAAFVEAGIAVRV